MPEQNSPIVPGDLFARHQTITGLRALADFLEANPDVPVCEYGWTLRMSQGVSQNAETDAHQRAEVDRVAALLDVEPSTTPGGHYQAFRRFGRIVYQISHIPARRMEEHEALMSYADHFHADGRNEPGRAA
ncbi:hypothetical protein [Actinomadura kijaniata]|uniref:hypothetical protein n=1 Tax=Actinomadura kijaniata TaxID=46161 RepID=UPI00082B6280|nr:hypothetical protein [Actinomadura kijaniata]